MAGRRAGTASRHHFAANSMVQQPPGEADRRSHHAVRGPLPANPVHGDRSVGPTRNGTDRRAVIWPEFQKNPSSQFTVHRKSAERQTRSVRTDGGVAMPPGSDHVFRAWRAARGPAAGGERGDERGGGRGPATEGPASETGEAGCPTPGNPQPATASNRAGRGAGARAAERSDGRGTPTESRRRRAAPGGRRRPRRSWCGHQGPRVQEGAGGAPDRRSGPRSHERRGNLGGGGHSVVSFPGPH